MCIIFFRIFSRSIWLCEDNIFLIDFKVTKLSVNIHWCIEWAKLNALKRIELFITCRTAHWRAKQKWTPLVCLYGDIRTGNSHGNNYSKLCGAQRAHTHTVGIYENKVGFHILIYYTLVNYKAITTRNLTYKSKSKCLLKAIYFKI